MRVVIHLVFGGLGMAPSMMVHHELEQHDDRERWPVMRAQKRIRYVRKESKRFITTPVVSRSSLWPGTDVMPCVLFF